MDLNLLKKAKKEKHLTFQTLSEKSGIPKRTLEDIFSERTPNPRVDTVEAIEKALGLNQQLEWTEKEIALGVGKYPTYLSEDEKEWLELRSEILRIHGEQYFNTLKIMLNALINKKGE